jgi:inner membrane protein
LDSITHIALGACIGEAFFEKGFGKKAMGWGIMAQSIPDIDFIASFWMDIPSAMLAHRGFTHSIFFAVLVIPLFSMIAERLHRPRNIRFQKWLLFFATAIFIHIFIDAFNSYGVGWFEPFSNQRISFNTLYVADPFFSIIPLFSACFLLISNAHHLKRGLMWRLGLFIPLLYLGYTIFNKFQINKEVNNYGLIEKDSGKIAFITPAPFQNWLWYVVIKNDSGFWVGYHTLWNANKNNQMKFFLQKEKLVKEIDNHESLQRLIRFSQGFYILNQDNQNVVFSDLRFGQILGWKYPSNPFVFNFNLKHSENNELLIQRGRMSGWNSREWLDYYKIVFDFPLERLK